MTFSYTHEVYINFIHPLYCSLLCQPLPLPFLSYLPSSPPLIFITLGIFLLSLFCSVFPYPANGENMQYLFVCDWIIFLNMMISGSIHFAGKYTILFFLMTESKTSLFRCTFFLYPFIHLWASGNFDGNCIEFVYFFWSFCHF
jgi:hypothetical protein